MPTNPRSPSHVNHIRQHRLPPRHILRCLQIPPWPRTPRQRDRHPRPLPFLTLNRQLPPWSLTIRRTISIPSPVPLFFVVNHGSCIAATTQDKTIGSELVVEIRRGDVVLRDMGYFSLGEFTAINACDAWWLTRLTRMN